ncbi:MAG: diadenylate cyclase [Bacilli bacterium]|nr:diadenylate cyclase [Bacilli bacterium]
MLDFSDVRTIVDLSIGLVLIAAVILLAIKIKFNKWLVVGLIGFFGLIVVACLFNLNLVSDVLLVVGTAFVLVLAILKLGAIRALFSKSPHGEINKKHMPKKIIDREALVKEVEKAVLACSRQKIGAIITFEKHDNLTPLTKNGTIINAPVKSELLTTIFYPGTRLHDGAVIIKDNMIYAASVYYTPTTKALTGKYGSRHRAAIGISEISDSITVVVSEETGRISIAQIGELDTVNPDKFARELLYRMNESE